ncbi:hypothetical protein [Pseudomonas sp. NW5]|uniref:hypothetical protein n=1 Tax=Pseudomonas sp. NW5 TaxID=2934934 RepID=UPI0020226739|nr:hypothetical protein [Pseudomonas sp. NW5]MCL7462256.1 hypothetical protein [Pseudomonas sp. NW5]
MARTLGLRMLGLDYITPDISQPWQAVGGCFIEINAVPALDVSREQLLQMGLAALGAEPAAIPVLLLVLPEAQRVACADWLAARSARPALGWLCGEQLSVNAAAWPVTGSLAQRVAMLLRHQCVERALVVCSAAELREGLPLSALTGALIWPGELDEAWQQVLTRHAEALHTVRSPAQWQAILQSFCEFPHAPDQRPVPR